MDLFSYNNIQAIYKDNSMVTFFSALPIKPPAFLPVTLPL